MAESKGKTGGAASAGAPSTQEDPVAAQLGPINEFRERADSWMKEITAQVARLAGRSEEEDRRKQAMDKRLADIEGRMQSLLTLTEMVSSSKNPFAGPSRSDGASGNAPSETAEQPAPPRGPPSPAPSAEAPPQVQTAAPDARASHPSDGRSSAPETEPTVPGPAPSAERTGPAPSAAPAPRLPAPAKAHPNDAHAEAPAAPTRPEQRSVADTFPRTPPRTDPKASAAVRTDVRYFVLEWARVLAPCAHRIDLGAFLGFYVECGWVDASTIAAVRNLTLQLTKDDDQRSEMSLEELHARSILLVSRLEGVDQAPEEARTVLWDAREAACGDWAILER